MFQQVKASLSIDEEKMHDFLGKVVGDFGATLSSVLGYIGIKLGLYKALAESNGMTPDELAQKTNTNERYIREWLINQASGGYIEYDPNEQTYSLTAEQNAALTNEDSQFYVGGGFYLIKALINASPRITENFQNGNGMLWGDHDPDLFLGTEKFFRPGYKFHLISEWIPALTGIEEKLKSGAKVADVGCGHGASTILMAEAFPNSNFFGFDMHKESIEMAEKRAQEAGVADRVNFKVADAAAFPNEDFDLICFFDCLHDMGSPEKVARHAFETLNDEGSVLLVEPMAGKKIEDNFNPIGRTFSAASTLCCTPNALATGGDALGAVASDDALKSRFTAGGFTEFRRATETPFNRVFEARRSRSG